jgi:Leucine-rich repeat (LRR) protein
VFDNYFVILFRQLIFFLAIEVIIISATNTENTCITEEIRAQYGFQLKFIPDNHYKNFDKQAKQISHHNLQLDLICSQAFVGLKYLEILDLSQNRLTHLVKNTFKPLISVVEIDLSENRLTIISFDEFADNQQLKRLYLLSNNIQTIEPIQHKSGFSITKLGFYGNQLVNISELCQLTKLKMLDLSHNENLDYKCFKSTCWSELRYLFLINTGLKQLNNDYRLFTGLTKLEKLHLGKNRLKVLCVGNFPELPELIHLNIADNQLQSLDVDDINSKFPQLRQIAVSKNLWSCDYFKKLETDLKKMKINIASGSTEANCIEGSNMTERSSSEDKCGTKDYKVATDLLKHFTMQISLAVALVIVDIVLSFYFVRH